MIAATLVMLLGIGIGALGLVAGSMYVVGALVASIGVIGALVRLADLLRSRPRLPTHAVSPQTRGANAGAATYPGNRASGTWRAHGA